MHDARATLGPISEPAAWPPELVDAYVSQRLGLVRLAFLITADPHVAEEIVQDAFVAALRAWDRVRLPNAYLRTSVVNGSRSWLKRRGVERRRVPEPASHVVSEPDELWDVLTRLKPRQRAAVVLRYYEGLPDAEVAAVLGCRVATVRTTIHRALGAMRKEIQR